MQQEINVMMHVSISHILVDLPLKGGDKIDNFAAILNRHLSNMTVQQKFIIRIQIPGNDNLAELQYAKFVALKELTDFSPFLSVMLELGPDLPSKAILDRFFGEKVFGIQIATDSFLSNPKGYPVLSKAHQQICK